MNKFLDRFYSYLKITQHSSETIKQYTTMLNAWVKFINDFQNGKSLMEIDDLDIEEYISWLQDSNKSSQAIITRIRPISSFFLFAKKKRIVDSNPMEYVDLPKAKNKIVEEHSLSCEQVNQIRDMIQENISSAKGIEDINTELSFRLFYEISIRSGARKSAVLSLTWEQLDKENLVFKDVCEKEGYIVDLIIDSNIVSLLDELKLFRESNGINDGGSVISCSAYQVWRRLRKYGLEIGISNLHPHDLRHTFATTLLNGGVPIEVVSEALHHTNLDVLLTSIIYSKIKSARMS